ncbi:hypothetical protein CLV98_104235 [Dyadobacter jejuensis]|uniref:EamA-like transporter family protein n=1 Tax=Dyadobacter jejuensis TaxID=1082580 RepID=A0A316AL66_9BACT|nr:hypothetical protein [Dyadobacter jejuensis]PWJ58376.1 hypothetical protein CLV98_104235 [Dyadobacter jejuensis]
MIYFALSVFFTVCLYLIMRAYPSHRVNSFHAVVVNYYACVLTGLVLTPDLNIFSQIDYSSKASLLTLSLGALFIAIFLLIGLTAQKVSVTASSLAANMSLVIPVVFGLFIFQNNNKVFTPLNYAGIVLALVALTLGGIKKNSTQHQRRNLWLLSLPILTFIGTGTNNTLINYLTFTYYSPSQSTVFMIIACSGAALIGTLLLATSIWKTKEMLSIRSIMGGVLLGIPNFLSLYFLLKALQIFANSAAFVFPIYNILTMLVSSVAAWLLYKEKLSGLNRLGLLVAIISVILISYQELGISI